MINKLEILLVEDETDICNEFSQQIYEIEDMILVKATNDSNTAIQYIKDYQPDVVILDLELHHGSGSGLDVLQALQTLSISKRPYFLITTNNSSSTTYEIARSLGADFIMSKHQQNYSTKGVLDFLGVIKGSIKKLQSVSTESSNNSPETKEQYTRRIRQHIMTELNHVGISPKSVGYTYLTDAIFIMQGNPTQNICTLIAEMYHKSEASVERAMQNAINRAWKVSDINELLRHYTAKISSSKGNPTLTEFICYYSNKIKNEY